MKNRETELNVDLPARPPVKTAENVMSDMMSIVMVFRYSKFSGFLKQKAYSWSRCVHDHVALEMSGRVYLLYCTW